MASSSAFHTRLLTRPGLPSLELIEAAPSGESRGAPILFVHGAFAGAWCWQEHCLEAFAAGGRHVFAMSLRGHGGSEGRRHLAMTTLDDYVADLRSAIAAMPAPPVVIGHSLGGYLAQILLGQVGMRALVLMASLPPEGLAFIGPRVAMTDPGFWLEGMLGSAGQLANMTEIAATDAFFGDDIAPMERRRHARRMVPESGLALAQTHISRWIVPAPFAGVQTLVVQAGRDRLIWPLTASRTAFYHGAESVDLPDSSHLVMLDAAAPLASRSILSWLGARGL